MIEQRRFADVRASDDGDERRTRIGPRAFVAASTTVSCVPG